MDRDQVNSSLIRKGFIRDDDRNHWFYHHEYEGKRTGVRTKLSRGSKYKRLDSSLQSRIKKQLKLGSSSDFRDLVNCPMSREDYINKLKENGIIADE